MKKILEVLFIIMVVTACLFGESISEFDVIDIEGKVDDLQMSNNF
ncbi:hypothetical protein ACIGC1_23525 [Peribacillus butanolivorans]